MMADVLNKAELPKVLDGRRRNKQYIHPERRASTPGRGALSGVEFSPVVG